MSEIHFFTGGADLYGANKILLLILGLVKHKKILYVPQEGPLTERLKQYNSEVEIRIIKNIPVIAKMNLNPKGIYAFFKSMFKFRGEVKDKIPQDAIVYINTLAVLPVAFFVSNYRIIHVHEILSNVKLLNRVVNKLALKLASKIICVSEATTTNLKEEADSNSSKKILTILNGIPPVATSTKKNSTNKEYVNILLVGRIKPRIKGQCYALQAIARLPEDLKNKIHVIFVGSPVPGQEDDLKEVEELIYEKSLSKIVEVKSFTSNISEMYEWADICLVPSIREDPFPTTVLEAMSMGLPVIGTNLGGIPEMISNNVSGFLIPLDNPQIFAEKIKLLVNNENLRKEMGLNGRSIFNENYTIENYKNRLKNTIPEIFN